MPNVFVIGATGYVGGHLARHLTGVGHRVSGLARSADAAVKLLDDRIEPVAGDLDERLSHVIAAALAADATIYAAQIASEREPAVLHVLCEALAGTGRTFVFLSGSGVFLQRTADSGRLEPRRLRGG